MPKEVNGMARVLFKYVKLPSGAAERGVLVGMTGTTVLVGAWVAIAIISSNIKVEFPNGLQGVLITTLAVAGVALAVALLHTAFATSKGERIEPDAPSGPTAEELLPSAKTATVVEETTRRSETVTTRRDEAVSTADRALAEGSERNSNDPLKRRGGAPEPASQEAGTGRTNQGQDRSREQSSQQRGDERRNVSPPPPPPPAPAPAQPAPAPLVTATATASVVEGDGAKKKEPEKAT